MGKLDSIQHIVVLMLENRSFDSMLGRLYPASPAFDGLSGAESNPDLAGTPVQIWSGDGIDEAAVRFPAPDPGELWTDINTQLYGHAEAPAAGEKPAMNGFVRNYQEQAAPALATDVARGVMHAYSEQQVPVMSRLAKQFAVCDRWFASAPCQTWPNRFFVHTGTANGYENNGPPHFPYLMPTIFDRFEDLEVDNGWKIYFHDLPQALTLARLLPHVDRFRPYATFGDDVANGTLPAYSFIEPRYFQDADLPNDQHPPHAVTLGEQLIADVYNTLRSGPGWDDTLLVICYDEHGGCYDHVPPPQATPPGAPTSPFNFDRYGVRVPAVLVSPRIAPGTILRPPGDVPFDHTSILATLRKRFGLGQPLSRRDAVAPDLECVLTLDGPDNQGPEHVEANPYVPSDAILSRRAPLNGFQLSLLDLVERLPEDIAQIDASLAAMIASPPMTLEAYRLKVDRFRFDAAQALAEARSRLSSLFSSL
ncbi:alkaline phosphatase family protein [Paludibacterium yongneupense]|uniref:alkaline phosphatase family protein n=1 Tax=Paludibacterium yongneupense TaxID=400061 RepID=UPI0003F9AA9B|nr:alkaline phosphatase family protein [Paludibacterium yongneupense]